MQRIKAALSDSSILSRHDLVGLAQLGAEGVEGITGIVEAMHHAVTSLALPVGAVPPGRLRGISAMVYRGIQGSARLTGKAVSLWKPRLPEQALAASARRAAFVSALNGAVGDHLESSGNPLAIRMSLVRRGHAPTGRLLVLVHGLGMNPDQWHRNGHDHGEALAQDLNFTPVYLHYNSGKHVAENGREFADRLEALVTQWPVPVDQLVILGHSMGGLVARSACALDEPSSWRHLLTHLICLGTPHHGAPLERGGRLLDVFLGASPYSEPISRIGRFRSAGITDLRFGTVRQPDGTFTPNESGLSGGRLATQLPSGVSTYLVAATIASGDRTSRGAWLGDGLVPVDSALGDHPDPLQALHVPLNQRFLLTNANHWDLLDRQEVYQALRSWLS